MLPKVEQTVLRAIDPHLGHAYLSREDLKLLPDEEFVDGCVRFGPDTPGATRVAALGGSTSDVSLAGSWLRPFRALGAACGHNLVLFSGAVSGYSSSQELLKLIRDLVPLGPRVVISLNGINDLGFVQAMSPEHPMVHAYQRNLFRHLARKPEATRKFFGPAGAVHAPGSREVAVPAFNQKLAIDGVAYGARNTLPAARVWARNAVLARAVCREIGAEYRCFLQPVIGVGEYALSPDERESLDAYAAERAAAGMDYLALVRDFYAEARALVCAHADFMVDLVDVFAGHPGMYSDVRHPNAAGNELLAERIFAHCATLL